jgi:hypothetical protein
MSNLDLLSVAEDDGYSDRLTVSQSQMQSMIERSGNRSYMTVIKSTIKISITKDRKLIIRESKDGSAGVVIEFPHFDIDGMAEFIQEVKTFISEEEMIEKLKATK